MTKKRAKRVCLQIMVDRVVSAQADDLVSCGYVEGEADAEMVCAELRRMESRLMQEISKLAD